MAGPQDLPETMQHPETGVTLVRGRRPQTVRYKGMEVVVEVSGYFPPGTEGQEVDGVLVGDDMAPMDAALKDLRARVEKIPSPPEIRSLRQKLGLSQREAGALFRVGENAFDKYERGLAQPSGPTAALMALVDRHPALISDLRQLAMPGSEAA